MRHMCRAAELPELGDRHICADYLEGLIHVVARRGREDTAGRLCLGYFAIQLYGGLLQERDHKFPRWCWGSVFLPPHDKVRAPMSFGVACTRYCANVQLASALVSLQMKVAKSGAVSQAIWGMIQKNMRPSLRYVSPRISTLT